MNAKRWIVTGAAGQLGGHLLRCLNADGLPAARVLGLVRSPGVDFRGAQTAVADLADADALRAIVRRFRPGFILHVGAMSAVGQCHEQPELARRVNADAARTLAEVSAECGARMVFTSSDMVFDGQSAPYRESDTPRPVSCYGHTKAAAEHELREFDHVLTVRIPLMYGLPCVPRPTTFATQINALHEGRSLRLFTDEFRTPLWLGDAARTLVALAHSAERGMMHIAGPARLSRYELIARIARVLEIDRPQLDPISRLSGAGPEPRPADLSLDASRFAKLFPRLVPRAVEDLSPAEIDA